MPIELLKQIYNDLRRSRAQSAAREFIEHNRKVFPLAKDASLRKAVILFELNAMQSGHIAYSYLANVLAASNHAQIKAYIPRAFSTVRQKLQFSIRKVPRLNEYGIYKSFGASDIFHVSPSKSQKARARVLLDEVFARLRSKRDVEALTVNGVWIGDLIYDSYLMRFKKPTIDLKSPELQGFLGKSLELFVFWEDYFDENDVRAINVSHCVYNLALPLRMAVQRNIPAFTARAIDIYRINSHNLFTEGDFVDYRRRFATLPDEMRKLCLAEAKQRVNRRFAGEVGVDMTYSTKSAYGTKRHPRLVRESPRKKILIATHCFFDSPHSYGNNLFPDFWEWLDFLGRTSEDTDYDWYIKTHPDYLSGTMEIIQSFAARYPKFTLLPSDASHHQIIAEGIDVALTVYGTIAFEYAALGVPVINASRNNPHIAYDFNLHPKDVDEYRGMLRNLDTLELAIDPEQIYEYYFMRYIHNTGNLFFDSFAGTIKKLGGYDKQFAPEIYDEWLSEWNPEKHEARLSALRRFCDSGDFRMDHSYLGGALAFQPGSLKS